MVNMFNMFNDKTQICISTANAGCLTNGKTKIHANFAFQSSFST